MLYERASAAQRARVMQDACSDDDDRAAAHMRLMLV